VAITEGIDWLIKWLGGYDDIFEHKVAVWVGTDGTNGMDMDDCFGGVMMNDE